MSDVTGIEEAKPYKPMLEEIATAFRAVFPDEKIKDVEYSRPGDYEIFAIRSDKMTRRYLRSDLTRSFEAILRDTPHIPPDKTA